jgi:hypothetical protein
VRASVTSCGSVLVFKNRAQCFMSVCFLSIYVNISYNLDHTEPNKLTHAHSQALHSGPVLRLAARFSSTGIPLFTFSLAFSSNSRLRALPALTFGLSKSLWNLDNVFNTAPKSLLFLVFSTASTTLLLGGGSILAGGGGERGLGGGDRSLIGDRRRGDRGDLVLRRSRRRSGETERRWYRFGGGDGERDSEDAYRFLGRGDGDLGMFTLDGIAL